MSSETYLNIPLAVEVRRQGADQEQAASEAPQEETLTGRNDKMMQRANEEVYLNAEEGATQG